MTKNIDRDFGTGEMHRRLTVIVPKYSTYGAKVMDEAEIDRLLLRGWLTQNQHGTLEGLMRRLHKASFVGVKSPSYEAPANNDPSLISQKKTAAIRAVVKLFQRMDDELGREKRTALINLVLLDHEWPWDEKDLSATVGKLDDIIAGRI